MATILVVDDSAFARSRLIKLFKQGGHQVVACAERGGEALEAYRRAGPELVTMDYVLEDMTGERAMKEIMALDPAARIIMISGAGDSNLRRRALDAGAAAFVKKFDLDVDLLQVIDQVLSG